jgi:hypothetical protein
LHVWRLGVDNKLMLCIGSISRPPPSIGEVPGDCSKERFSVLETEFADVDFKDDRLLPDRFSPRGHPRKPLVQEDHFSSLLKDGNPYPFESAFLVKGDTFEGVRLAD